MVWMAEGGVVSGPAGVDKVPAMLSAGEVVLNAAQQQNVGRKLQGSGTVVQIIVKDNVVYGDDKQYFQKVGDSIVENFKMHAAFQSF